MHVQKFIYLANGFYLAAEGKALIAEPFEAWSFGPVISRLYDALKFYGSRPITRLIHWGDDSPFGHDALQVLATSKLTNFETETIQSVWDNYSQFPAFQLLALTHEAGTPWFKAFEAGKNTTIPNVEIAEYFRGL